MIMYLNNHLFSKNYGMAGAVSVVLFLVCAVPVSYTHLDVYKRQHRRRHRGWYQSW